MYYFFYPDPKFSKFVLSLHSTRKVMVIPVRRDLRFLLLLCPILLLNTSCASRESLCEANRQYKTVKTGTKRTRGGIPYTNKARPVRKDYVVGGR